MKELHLCRGEHCPDTAVDLAAGQSYLDAADDQGYRVQHRQNPANKRTADFSIFFEITDDQVDESAPGTTKILVFQANFLGLGPFRGS